jgi:multiple antibiotic resistance protein
MVKELSLVLKFIPLSFIALYPLVSPIASGLMFVALVPNANDAKMKMLARKIAINSLLFLLVFQIAGAYLFRLLGISMPILQVVGGLVLASMGWGLLNKKDPGPGAAATAPAPPNNLEGMAFYPLTFPLSVGPGCIVVAITLGARASFHSLSDSAFMHLGLLIGTALICIATYFTHAYAHQITTRLSAADTEGVLRLLAFILICIGGEIIWTGIQSLLKTIS